MTSTAGVKSCDLWKLLEKTDLNGIQYTAGDRIKMLQAATAAFGLLELH
jgi:hypothetical protein